VPEDPRTELETTSQAWFERDRKCSNKACLLQQDINRKKREEYLYKRDHKKLPEALIWYGCGIFYLRLLLIEKYDLWTYPVECDNSPRASLIQFFKKKRARKDGGNRDHGHTSALAAGASEYASSSLRPPVRQAHTQLRGLVLQFT
jgi:hypothetical protein